MHGGCCLTTAVRRVLFLQVWPLRTLVTRFFGRLPSGMLYKPASGSGPFRACPPGLSATRASGDRNGGASRRWSCSCLRSRPEHGFAWSTGFFCRPPVLVVGWLTVRFCCFEPDHDILAEVFPVWEVTGIKIWRVCHQFGWNQDHTG